MNYQFSFSKWMYLKNSWYKYFIPWIGISIALSAMMYFNGKLSVASGSVAALIILFFTILMMINRVRTWKKSKVELSGNGIKLTCVKADGYEANIELGRKKRVVTYSAFPIKKVELSGHSVRVYGDIIVTEQTHVNSVTRNKERRVSRFVIPPYFTDWQTMLKHLNKQNGGSEHEQ